MPASLASTILAREFALVAVITHRTLFGIKRLFQQFDPSSRSAWNFGSYFTTSMFGVVASVGRFSLSHNCQPPSRMVTFSCPRYFKVHHTRAVSVKTLP